jgi:hypothetical protein
MEPWRQRSTQRRGRAEDRTTAPKFRREAIRLVYASEEERPIPKTARDSGVTAETLAVTSL